jgi:predicted DsbA family dithiol-disulfide isomerase
MAELRIDVWSDIACPWCYVAKRRLEAALARFPYRDAVVVQWRAFELDPNAPRERGRDFSYAERLAKKYGKSVVEAEAMIARMVDFGKSEGVSFRFDRIRHGNTFDAHRVIHLAGERGVQGAVKERLFRARMTEGEPIGNPETLARLAGEAGLDSAEVSAMLAGDAYARAVRQDEAEARDLGIAGVPFFLIAGRYGVCGAQPAEILLEAITRAWSELPSYTASPAEGAVCGPDGCH